MAARWTPDEDGALRALYAAQRPLKDIAAALGRSPDSVTARRRQIGIAPRHQVWAAREDALLRAAAASGIPAAWVASRLSRIPDAVRRRQRALGGGRPSAAPYTPAHDEALRRRCRQLGLEPPPAPEAPRSGKPWTASEDAVLRMHSGLNPAVLAERLGRSDHAISRRMRALGLRDERRRSPHHPAARVRGLTPAQRSAIRRAPDPLKPTRAMGLAHRLDLPPATVREVAALPPSGRSPG